MIWALKTSTLSPSSMDDGLLHETWHGRAHSRKIRPGHCNIHVKSPIYHIQANLVHPCASEPVVSVNNKQSDIYQ